MRNKILIIFPILILSISMSFGIDPINPQIGSAPSPNTVEWRAACTRPTQQTELSVNNVRARVLTGGDLWSSAQYIVPKPAPRQLPVSALYAGGVWVGGINRAGNIRLAAVTYRNLGFDFFTGPLDLNGVTDDAVCRPWDRFFKIDGRNVLNHYDNVVKLDLQNIELDCDAIPDDIKYWPGRGNPYWRQRFDFSLPDQELGDFYDYDQDLVYDPCKGDFPIIRIRDCEPGTLEKAKELIGDEMIFWIYNDNGGPQTLSGPTSIQMEVQVQSFAYATNDEINDMTFYRYRLLNKANEDLLDCYFAMWVDPDLGCYSDDFIGCDIGRSLAYVYNQDALDGVGTTANCAGVNTYGAIIPMVGIDYFRGPRGPRIFDLDANGVPKKRVRLDGADTVKVNGMPVFDFVLLEPPFGSGQVDTLIELGMSSFTYHENCGVAPVPPGMCDPQARRDEGFYNLIRGLWADGTPFTRGGSGYNPGSTDSIKYAFPGDPNNTNDWSMCQPGLDLPFGDRRTLQATGPLLLQPGAENELIVGVVFVPDVKHPCPSLGKIRIADDIAQALFDNCFNISNGPDAPDVTAVELDRELILMFSNEPNSNNYLEEYEELDLQAPLGVDNTYKFEGYRLYQLANGSVSVQELGDINKARQIAQVDVKNDVIAIYNWSGQENPLDPVFGPTVWTPTRMVSGQNKGIQSTFRITEDQFAATDKRLINHKPYYFLALAYGHNNWKNFDILAETNNGQRRAYLEGRRNVGGDSKRPYVFVPRPIVYENLQANYGDGAVVTRIAGEGNPGIFLELEEGMYDKILSGNNDKVLKYKEGLGPINAKVVDPLRVKDGKYRLEVSGTFVNSPTTVCAFDKFTKWNLYEIIDNQQRVVLKDKNIFDIKEHLINEKGISLSWNNEDEPGTLQSIDNGAIGARIEYKDPNGAIWFNAVKGDGGVFQVSQNQTASFPFLDFLRRPYRDDPTHQLSKMGDGYFIPYASTKTEGDPEQQFYFSPGARALNPFLNNPNIGALRLRDLNNVDIVFTNDKSKWSKCVVVETSNSDFLSLASLQNEGNVANFALRKKGSVDQDGKPLNDGTEGFSYFPGYAVDVETGKRLNIFFGESSYLGTNLANLLDGGNPIGADMIFNPSPQTLAPIPGTQGFMPIFGGFHYIYVTRQEYDECQSIATALRGSSLPNRTKGVAGITWTSFPLGVTSHPMLPIERGLIPNEMTVKLRVKNPYGQSRKFTTARERDCETDGDNPIYEFEFRDKESKSLLQEEYEGALANVNVVPNPYYAYSAYETSQFTNVVKITNLPAKAVVTIYSIDGSFIKQYNRDERGSELRGVNRPTSTSQVYPDLEWDLKNFRDIPVASGVYLIHIAAPELNEERTIKWFGIGRKFDPNGL